MLTLVHPTKNKNLLYLPPHTTMTQHLFVNVESNEHVRAVLLRHLSAHWLSGLIWLIWLARWVPSLSLATPCIPPEAACSKRTMSLDRGGLFFGHGYMSSRAPLLKPNKLSRSACRRTQVSLASKTRAHPSEALRGGLPFCKEKVEGNE